jgi:hypothetical protein
VQVPNDWSGTVTPTKTDYDFAPVSRPYSNVTSDQTNQDYVGTSIYDLNPDGVIDLLDLKVIHDNWLTVGPAGDIDDSGLVDLGDFALLGNAW